MRFAPIAEIGERIAGATEPTNADGEACSVGREPVKLGGECVLVVSHGRATKRLPQGEHERPAVLGAPQLRRAHVFRAPLGLGEPGILDDRDQREERARPLPARGKPRRALHRIRRMEMDQRLVGGGDVRGRVLQRDTELRRQGRRALRVVTLFRHSGARQARARNDREPTGKSASAISLNQKHVKPSREKYLTFVFQKNMVLFALS